MAGKRTLPNATGQKDWAGEGCCLSPTSWLTFHQVHVLLQGALQSVPNIRGFQPRPCLWVDDQSVDSARNARSGAKSVAEAASISRHHARRLERGQRRLLIRSSANRSNRMHETLSESRGCWQRCRDVPPPDRKDRGRLQRGGQQLHLKRQ